MIPRVEPEGILFGKPEPAFPDHARINQSVTSFLYAPPTIGPVRSLGPGSVVRIMLRFKVVVPVVPLIAAAIFARVEFLSGPRPCVTVGSDSLQIASLPFHADLHV